MSRRSFYIIAIYIFNEVNISINKSVQQIKKKGVEPQHRLKLRKSESQVQIY